MTPPSSAALRRLIDDAAARRSVAPGRLHYTVASTVVLQMVPYGVAKGGGAIRQRVNEHDARLTKDLDLGTLHHAGWLGRRRRVSRRRSCRPPRQVAIEVDTDPRPVVFGHYWATGSPTLRSKKAVCVDYSASMVNGSLVAYRWSGETKLVEANLVSVPGAKHATA